MLYIKEKYKDIMQHKKDIKIKTPSGSFIYWKITFLGNQKLRVDMLSTDELHVTLFLTLQCCM